MPQLPSIVLPNGITVYIWHITDSQEMLRQRYEECMAHQGDSNDLGKISGELEVLTVSTQHKHFLASRILMNTVFGNHRLGRTEDGKPHLESVEHADVHTPNTHINYSHADDWVVLACHPNFPVGIDVESPREQLHRIYRRFCSANEIHWMGEQPSTQLLQKAWCAKEALYKAIGKKGTDFRDQLYLHPIEDGDAVMPATIRLNVNSADGNLSNTGAKTHHAQKSSDAFFSAIENSEDNQIKAGGTVETTVHFFNLQHMMVAAVIIEGE